LAISTINISNKSWLLRFIPWGTNSPSACGHQPSDSNTNVYRYHVSPGWNLVGEGYMHMAVFPNNFFFLITRILQLVKHCIIKRKLKQWWSTIPPISTKRKKKLSPYFTEHKNGGTTFDTGNRVPVLGQVQQCSGVHSLDKWISNGNTFMNKR
jgi:hypothetical protein